ncbi:hypothetical protein [Acinetobacter sp.]|uniref:hypothetical protein n=1 Tax=Acinetobacter sp. TaxID=472 RepID=UPI002FCA6124
MAELMQQGEVKRHIRKIYQQRRDYALMEFQQVFDCRAEIAAPAGIHLVCWLKGAWTEQRFIEKCAQADLAVQPLLRYCQSAHAKAAVLFGYAAHTPEEITVNIEKLAQRIGRG